MSAALSPRLPLTEAQRAALFPAAIKYAYLDNAYRGPTCTPSADAARAQIDESARNGSLSIGPAQKAMDATMAHFARFVGAKESEVCFLANATEAFTRVTLGIDWRAGDRVVAPADDYPGVLRPLIDLKRRGVEVTLVPAGKDGAADLLAACDAKTRLVASSHVSFRHGYRLDVAALCAGARKRGVLTVIDCVQSVGALQVDVAAIGCDFATFAARKFLCALDALGVLYVRGESLGKLTPSSLGMFSVAEPYDMTKIEQPLAAGARRFRLGAASFAQVAAMEAALGLAESIGIAAIEKRVLALNADIRKRAKAARIEIFGADWPESARSAIVALKLPAGRDEAVHKSLRAANVIASVRNGLLRVSPHYYNNEADLDRLFAVL
ncbi:MAG: aminotransferase class V-fold PLP-dependent enzyme [Planctomycetes bacterium]|nr:aminotransferase class V-fold PLP-dependent enzyme [Planctomycetota bacterium]